jgi:hypothetical protein
MVLDYHYYIGIWPRFHLPPFFKVFHEEGNRKNHQKDVVTYDWDRSIDRKHRPDVEGKLAIRSVWSCNLFHYANSLVSICSQFDQS